MPLKTLLTVKFNQLINQSTPVVVPPYPLGLVPLWWLGECYA